MNNPHVNSLYYKIIPGQNIDYKKAPSFEYETEDFNLLIKDDVTIFQMKTHYPSEDEARKVTDNFLETWKVLIGLEHDPDDLSFRFDHSEVIDLDPNSSDKNIINLKASICNHVMVSDHVTLHLSRNKYPSRPINFSKSPDVETMYLRYMAYRKGRESLTSMAYICLTIFEASGNGRRKASKKYNIKYEVLRNLGELCSTRGNKNEARKAPKDGTFKPLSPKERDWILAAIR